MKKLRKFLVASVMTLSVIAMSGLTVAPAQAAASAGDLIKMDGLSSVYYLGDDGKRYVFPNEATYFSWYSDFSGVVTIPASELQSYPLGGNVTMRPGTTLVKITTDPSVYAVEPNGVLRKIANESQAAALYGTNWNKRIVDLADAFFTNYTIGQPLADGEIPAGSLVKNADSASVYYYDGTNYRSIASEAAMTANRFRFENVMTIANDITAGGSAVSAMEAALVDTAQGATGPGQVVTGSGLMVSLNSQTPVSMNIPTGVSVEFLKLNLTAASDGPVNVSSIKFSAIGLSDATYIDDVSVYDAGVKVGNEKSINSNREAIVNFSSPIYVAAGSTKTLTVKATIENTKTGSYGVGIANAADIVSSAANVSGSFPINSNLMSAVDNTGVGTLTIAGTPVSDTVSFGEDDVLLADFTLKATDEDALLQSIALYNGGTNANDIVSNLVLLIDGDEAATGSYADRYATFSVNNFEIEKNDTVYVEVRGDIGTTSADDTIELYLRNTTDIVAVGKTHGFGVKIAGSIASGTNEITLATGDFTIDMDKSATPAKDVKPGSTDVVLATIKMTSNGENATLLDILTGGDFYIAQTYNSSTTLENIVLVDTATGSIYDLAADGAITSGQVPLTLTEEIFFTKGVTKTFQVKADILDGIDEGYTYQVILNKTDMNIEGETSGATIKDILPSGISSAITTVKKASLTLTPTALVSTSVVGGAEDVVVYQAKVKAGTADDVKIQGLTLATSTSHGAAFTDNNITKLSLWLNGKLLKEVSGQINETTGTISFTSLNSANYTVAAGQNVDLVVTADFASNLLDAGDFELKASAVTARAADGNDVVSVTTPDTYSRLITVAEAGSLSVELLTSDSKANRDSYILAGASSEVGRYLGELKFVTTKEDIKVEKLVLKDNGTSADYTDIAAVKLVKADGTVVASEEIDSTGKVTFDPFDVVFEADKTTSLFISVEARGINIKDDVTATAENGKTIQFVKIATSTMEAIGVSSNEDITITEGTNNGVSKIATIVGVKLNSVVNAMADVSNFTGGTKDLAKYTLVFDGGDNRDSSNEALKAALSYIEISFATSSATVTSPYLYVDGHSSYKTISATSTPNGFEWYANELANLVDSGEFNGTITLVVAGTVSASGDNYWVETSIADLDGSSDDIQYTVNGAAVTGMLLSETSVQGATLSK